jgi:hypothetical protein
MLLNNFMASPSFQIWLTGQTLDIQQILYKADGSPRHSIFYIAHLSDSERMFFVTMLYSSIESWMRTQRGTAVCGLWFILTRSWATFRRWPIHRREQ